MPMRARGGSNYVCPNGRIQGYFPDTCRDNVGTRLDDLGARTSDWAVRGPWLAWPLQLCISTVRLFELHRRSALSSSRCDRSCGGGASFDKAGPLGVGLPSGKQRRPDGALFGLRGGSCGSFRALAAEY